MTLETRIKMAVYDHFAETGRPLMGGRRLHCAGSALRLGSGQMTAISFHA